MPSPRRARADQSARRINAAAELLESGQAAAAAARALARRYRVSQRQARRYLNLARASGRVRVPQPKVVLAVKVEASLDRRARSYARATRLTLSAVVSQALAELLEQPTSGHGRSTS